MLSTYEMKPIAIKWNFYVLMKKKAMKKSDLRVICDMINRI